jgi:outer membrane lipoprotein LolB
MVPLRRPEPGRLALPALLALLAALGGCRSLPPAAEIPWSQRCAALTASSQYSFSGRLAARSGEVGFSAALDWQQRGLLSLATLRGPLGAGTLHVTIDRDTVMVEDSAGERRSGDAGAAALRDALGFEPPLAALRYWLLACSTPDTPAVETADSAGHLSTLSQNGWQLEYSQYQSTAPYLMPLRMRASRDTDSLQLVIHRWRLQ